MERDVDVVAREVVGAALKVHRALGPGVLESVYQRLLEQELTERGFFVEREKLVSFEWEGLRFRDGLRLDMLVNEVLVVELKSVERLAPVHMKQLLTYLRLMRLPVGLLINFGGATLKEGLRRVVNGYRPPEDAHRVSAVP